MKSAVPAQKALQGFQIGTRELLVGTKEDIIFPDECLEGKSVIFD